MAEYGRENVTAAMELCLEDTKELSSLKLKEVITNVRDFINRDHPISSGRSHFGALATVLLLGSFFCHFFLEFLTVTFAPEFDENSWRLQPVN